MADGTWAPGAILKTALSRNSFPGAPLDESSMKAWNSSTLQSAFASQMQTIGSAPPAFVATKEWL